jgi:hypothetical protein
VDLVVEEVQNFFSLIPSGEALTFDTSLGRYAGVYNRKGYPSEEGCARDCSLLNGVAVAPSYCQDGVTADAVLSLTKPPTIPGVAGTGGSCASDATGRPTWIVFSWIQKIVGMAGTTKELLAQHRALVLHEIIHGLGFSNIKFRSATDSAGQNKKLVTLGPVVDLDGATDEVWYFTKGRAYELAQKYFGCMANGSWDGLPLMGLPELGRASHWETRIMRDEVGRTCVCISICTTCAMRLRELLGHFAGHDLRQHRACGQLHHARSHGGPRLLLGQLHGGTVHVVGLAAGLRIRDDPLRPHDQRLLPEGARVS